MKRSWRWGASTTAATSAGKWILTAGLGGMGGAQPLAAVMAGASCLAIECQQSRIDMRLRTGYLDKATTNLRRGARHHHARLQGEETRFGRAARERRGRSCRDCYLEDVRPSLLTDQTSAHDPMNGYLARSAGPWSSGSASGSAIRRRSRRPRASRWPRTCARCSTSTRPAFQRSTTATTSGKWRSKKASRTRSTSGLRAGLHPAAVLPRSRAVPLGRAVRAIRKTSTRPTRK